MKEKLISDSIYNLAVSKGYNLPLESYKDSYRELRYKLPTQSLLAKWLRDIHKFHIKIESPFGEVGWDVIIHKIGEYNRVDNADKEYYTYEEALEAGLVEALNLV